MFDPNKSYSIGVWDMTFYVVDNEADDFIRNENGSVKIFHKPNLDYSYMADAMDVDDLEESNDG